MKLWSPTEQMLVEPIHRWNWKWAPPDGPHGYIHIFDGSVCYVGMSKRNCFRSFDFGGRTKKHMDLFKSSKTGEIRHYPQKTIPFALAWERFTMKKAIDEGWDLCNQEGNIQGMHFMRQHLPKTYEKFLLDGGRKRRAY